MSVRVLVVDDSAVFGRVMKQALESIPGVEVAGLCRSGQAALERIRTDPPDVLTLDVEMPAMNGLDLLQAMRREGLKPATIMISGVTDRARDLTMRALELGALDFIPKPQTGAGEENLADLRQRLLPLVSAAARRKEVQAILRGAPSKGPSESAELSVEEYGRKFSAPAIDRLETPPRPPRRRAKPAMVLIGVSTGGPQALARVIPALPATLRVPVLIVQHMPPLFTATLARQLASCSALQVKEAEEGEIALAGCVYLAPGGKHLKAAAGRSGEILLRITSDAPENNCRPAVDVLFRAAATAFPGLSVAVILTGMGRDGTLGLRELRQGGVFAIAQDEASCTVFGMPKEAIQAGVVDLVVPLGSIAAEIVKAVG